VVHAVTTHVPVELALLDELLAEIVFLEAESPIYEVRLRNGVIGHPHIWTWVSQEGFTADSRRAPTCILEVDQRALGDLLAARTTCEELLASGALRVGGIESDWEAFLTLFMSPANRAKMSASRLGRPSRRLRTKLVDEATHLLKQRFGSLTQLSRICEMLDNWVEHRHGDDIRLGQVQVVTIPGLPSPPFWADRDALQIDDIVHRNFDDLRMEASEFLGRKSAPRYGLSSIDSSAAPSPVTTLYAPDGWRMAFLMDSYRPNKDRLRAFPVASRILDEIATKQTVLHCGYMIQEPGTTLPLHTDGGSWTVSYQYGVIVPPDCYLTVDRHRFERRERESISFNDSFFHSAGNLGRSPRILFTLVAASPDLTPVERAGLRLIHDVFPAATLMYPGQHDPDVDKRSDRTALARRVRAIHQAVSHGRTVRTRRESESDAVNAQAAAADSLPFTGAALADTLLVSLLDPAAPLGAPTHHIIDDWDPDAYFDHEYSGVHVAPSLTRMFRFVASQLQRIGETFESAVEIGCGPTVHNAALLVPWTRRLDLVDPNPDNLSRVRSWVARAPSAHDWSALIGGAGGVLDCESPAQMVTGDRITEREALLRERVCVRRGDILAGMPLGEPITYPLVTSFFCLEWAASTVEGWRENVVRLGSLLDDGGWLVLAVALETHVCIIDGRTFRSIYLSQDAVIKALLEIGIEASTIESAVIPLEVASRTEAADAIRGTYVVCGRKRTVS
jgi:hypothetical protein